MFNIQFNPAVTPQSYTKDAKTVALRSGTVRDKAVSQSQDASQPVVSGAVRAKAPLRQDQFQHSVEKAPSVKMREGNATNGLRTRANDEERYGFVEGMMVRCGSMMNGLLP
ncbi:MAG: hypothetical protein NTW61_03575 [Candidatus Melainabacteria bacterium]|jgi:hypothetical protein|nr:hypothetical protein [Candidatus Melainabacteria bacterium]